MSNPIKRYLKRNVRNPIIKGLSRFGLAINRIYENRNYDILSNGEYNILTKIALSDASCVFDVGANRGEYSTYVRQLIPAAHIYAFEPQEDPYSKLLERFGDDSKISCLNIGLSYESGTKALKHYGQSEHASVVNIKGMGRDVIGSDEIVVITGDAFLKEHHIDQIDLLKIDVEGSELDIIRGFETAFTNKKISACQFEYGYANISSGALLLNFYEFFGRNGYKLGKVYPRHVEFREYSVRHEDFFGSELPGR